MRVKSEKISEKCGRICPGIPSAATAAGHKKSEKCPLTDAGSNSSAAAKAHKTGISGLHEADIEGTDWSTSDDARRFACYEQATYHAPTRQTQSILNFEELDPRPVSNSYRARNDDDDLLEELDGRPGWSKYR